MNPRNSTPTAASAAHAALAQARQIAQDHETPPRPPVDGNPECECDDCDCPICAPGCC